jgi:hypothetical protein
MTTDSSPALGAPVVRLRILWSSSAPGKSSVELEEKAIELRSGSVGTCLHLEAGSAWRDHETACREWWPFSGTVTRRSASLLEERRTASSGGAVDLVGEDDVRKIAPFGTRRPLRPRPSLVDDRGAEKSAGMRSGVNWTRENPEAHGLR